MDYLKLAEEIIAIDTSVPPGRNYEKSIDYLLPITMQLGFVSQKIQIPPEYSEGKNDRFALVGHRRYPGKPRLIFYNHIDVVPAEGWNAFQPEINNGRLYGRGAADMKGGIVGLLLGLDKVKDKTLKYDTSIMITTDEEYNQADQLRFLAKYLEPFMGASVFSLDTSFGFVSITNLGLLQMDVIVKGKSVHSAMAHQGENAIEKAVPLMEALLKLKRKVVHRKSKIKTNPDTGLKHMEGRLNLNVIKGGIKANIIPDYCTITVDRRLIPEEHIDTAEKEIIDTLKTVPDVNWEIGRVIRIPTTLPVHKVIVDELSGIIKKITGKTGKYGEMGSGDLSAIVTSEWGGIDFGIGAIRPESNIHGKGEYVYIKDIEDLGKIISQFLAE
jgi:succinyl-diaminopimelate desuccinylase